MKKRVFGWLMVCLAWIALSPVVHAEEATVAEKDLPSIRGNMGAQIQMLSSPTTTSDASTTDGFEVNSSSGGPVLSFQGNFKKFSLEVAVPTSSPKYELLFFGSSMGEIEVATSTITAKWYPYEWHPMPQLTVLPYLGIGQQITRVSGHYSMGGTTFPDSYDKERWIWQGGFETSFLTRHTKNLFAVVDYKSGGTDYATQVPNGGPAIKISIEPVVSFGLGLRF